MQTYALELAHIAHIHSPIRHPAIKRAFDILFSLCVLITGFPLFALIAAGVFFSSPGPVIFLAKRIGRRGKVIYCYKFRSMYVDAEQKLQELLNKDATIQAEWDIYKKLKNDPRVTPLGKLLRKTSLDELPQFWNVLKGDLSIVGPRPFYLDEILFYFDDGATAILSVRPGLTGLWQISGRNNLSIKERIALDKKYMAKHSLIFDLLLILKTIPAIFFPKGAY